MFCSQSMNVALISNKASSFCTITANGRKPELSLNLTLLTYMCTCSTPTEVCLLGQTCLALLLDSLAGSQWAASSKVPRQNTGWLTVTTDPDIASREGPSRPRAATPRPLLSLAVMFPIHLQCRQAANMSIAAEHIQQHCRNAPYLGQDHTCFFLLKYCTWRVDSVWPLIVVNDSMCSTPSSGTLYTSRKQPVDQPGHHMMKFLQQTRAG